MLYQGIGFYKDELNTIIDEEKTNNYLKKTNELFGKVLAINPTYQELVNEVVGEIIKLHRLGYDQGKIGTDYAKEMPKSVYPIAGVKPKMFNDYDINQMKLLKEKGFSNYKIATKFKCNEKTIRNYLK